MNEPFWHEVWRAVRFFLPTFNRHELAGAIGFCIVIVLGAGIATLLVGTLVVIDRRSEGSEGGKS